LSTILLQLLCFGKMWQKPVSARTVKTSDGRNLPTLMATHHTIHIITLIKKTNTHIT